MDYIETGRDGYTYVLVCPEDENGNPCNTETRAEAEFGDGELSSPNVLYGGDIVCEGCGTKYHSTSIAFER